MSPLSSARQRSHTFLETVAEAMANIKGESGQRVVFSFSPEDYVIPGIMAHMRDGEYSMEAWVGVNQDRIFYIQNFGLPPAQCEEALRFSLGGAAKLNWSFSFQPTQEHHTSVWGTVERVGPLVHDSEQDGVVVSSGGIFWAQDVAMMAQSIFRTAQRGQIPPGLQCPSPP